MFYNQAVSVFGQWFYIRFIENPGMAFGMEFGGEWGKLALSILRIVAVIAIAWYINNLIKKGAKKGLIICLSLILAGAIGNILDSMFYGLLFSNSTPFELAQFMPAGGGYASFLQGRVVDMLYFPLFEGNFPDWLPFWGGQHYLFFSPIFNIADSAISIGVVLLIIFQKRYELKF
ncbi:MAG: signal peptidase II [Luteibaculaceae bacterium]|jgi:signal peptidase II